MIKFLIIIPLIIAAIIGGISIYLQPNDFMGCTETPLAGSEQCEKVDAIVVISGGDTNARTDEGIKLFENGWADAIVFSGAAQDKTSISNAGAMRLRALNAGIPDNSIFIEEEGATTQENAANTHTIFTENGFSKIMLVTSGYHERRATLEFKRSNPDVTVLSHPLLQDKDWSFFWWLTPRGWWLAGGEVAKTIAFYVDGAR